MAELFQTIAKNMLADIKRGDVSSMYGFVAPEHLLKQLTMKKIGEQVSELVSSYISKQDVDQMFCDHQIAVNCKPDTKEITIRWYVKKRDKEIIIKKNGTEWCEICDQFKPVIDFKKCGQCKCQRYCSRECQKSDWKEHKKVCGK